MDQQEAIEQPLSPNGKQEDEVNGSEACDGQDAAVESDVITENQVPLVHAPAHQPKNWDKIVKEFEEEEQKETNPADGSVDELFREIYEKGGEEVRRAMNKSFTESAGTVLSTNWTEVGKDKVDMKAPDGVEFKKWE
jgi:suppressor of G2 allele of SKP1